MVHADFPGFEAFHEFVYREQLIQDVVRVKVTQSLGMSIHDVLLHQAVPVTLVIVNRRYLKTNLRRNLRSPTGLFY
jgi:hypothetical protein